MLMAILRAMIVLAYTVFMSFMSGAALLLRNPDDHYRAVGYWWSRYLLKFCGVTVTVSGRERIPDPSGIIYVANHASMLDICVCYAYLPGQVRFVGKRELTFVPFFGWFWKLSGNIPIDRRSPKRFQRSLDFAYRTIERGKCIILFPEGTRTRSGQMQDFKRGPFSLAARSKATVVPVTINGSYSILRPGSVRIRPGSISVVIHEPVLPSDAWNGKDKEREMMTSVQEQIASAYIPQGVADAG